MNSATEQELSLGERFRLAREALNLSYEDVAKEIALRPAILQQLENNEFIQKSIPSTFMKGYVRSYAKFLHLPDSVWENVAFAETEKNDLSKNARSTRAVNQYASHSRWVGRLSVIVLIIVLGMTGLWWWQSYQQNNQERDNLVQNYVADTENQAAATGNESANKTESATTDNVTAAQSAPIVAQEAVTPSNSADLPQTAQENAGTNSPASDEKAVPDTQSAVENPTISPALPAAKGDLVIEVTNNSSWISVKDKNRRVLAQKEYKKGEVLTFNGDEFSLIVGAPGNVRIMYRGEDYPLKVDGRVAKFKLSQP